MVWITLSHNSFPCPLGARCRMPPVDDPSSDLSGRRFGQYRVLAKLGAGGMGVVYRAHDEQLERDLAIKVLPVGTLADDAARKRFRREALALSRLNHPNIATIYAFGNEAGVDYLAMELVAGASLQEKLSGGALPEKEVLALGAQISAALEEAHGQGVVHRDLKPGNIIVTPRGVAKVLDFGLARFSQPEGAPAGATAGATESVALTHAIVGTPAYMSPEQLRGDAVDARTDIYALGCVLYEMATGLPVFREELPTRLVEAILHRPPVAPRARNERISPELERIILKCLEKDPARRYQSARELGVDLQRLANPSAVSATPLAAEAPAVRARQWRTPALFGFGLLAAVLLGGLLVGLSLYRTRSRREAAASAPIESLAVLPLDNLSRDPGQDYFADGMTEELTADLAQIRALRVISRTSVMQYKGTRKTMPEIGRELNVDALIEGSVLHAGQRVRITAQLIRAATDQHLWAKSYEGDLSDVLTLQSTVAREIAREIKVALTPQDQARLASARKVNPEAHEAYLLGRYYWDKGNEADLKKSLEYYRKAQALDPHDPLVYAGLANTYTWMSDFYLSPREAMPQAQAAAAEALRLDESIAEAHSALATIHFLYDYDWPGAEREFKRAIELNPNFADALHNYANFLAAMKRPEESLAQLERAEQVSPFSDQVIQDSIWVRWLNRRYDDAIAKGRAGIAIDPQAAYTHINLGLACAQKGQFQEAIAHGETARKLDKGPLLYGFLGSIYAQSGKRAEAQKVFDTLKANFSRQYVCPYEIGTLAALLGNKDEAFQWYDRGFEFRSICMPFFWTDPRLDSIRSDPRYLELIRRLKFPQ